MRDEIEPGQQAQEAGELPAVTGHAPPSGSSASLRRLGHLFPLLALLIMILGVVLVYALFIRTNLWTQWYVMKPGLLVNMAEESGRLVVDPGEEAPSGYQEEPYWYREGLNVHSRRWVTTLLFLGLHDVTGLDMVSLTRAPFGIAIFLFALLYLFVSAKDSLSPVSQWGFLLASLLYLLSYWSLGWIYHSGAWPALALLFIILGLVFRLVRRRGHAVWERAFLLLFLFLNFWIYHGTMMLMVVFLPFLLIYGSAIQLVQTTPGVYAPPRPYLYQTLAMVSLAVFFLDPLSTFVLSATGVLRPWEGPHIFVSSLTEQSGNYATYLVGYPPIVRAAMVAQMVCPFAVATWLWISDHLLPLLRRQRLSETDIVIGALYLSVPVIVLGTVVVGQLRTSEPNLLLILATSLLLVRHVFRGERVSRGAVVRGSLVATALLVIMAGASVMHIRDPMSRYADVHDSDAGVAEWAAEKIDVPYFADAFFTGLVLMDNAEAEVVPLHGDLKELTDIIYDGPLPFAGELRERGAQLALLNDRNIDKPAPTGVRHAIAGLDFYLDPLPDYDYTSPDFGIVYDNGQSRVITIGAE